MAWQSMPPERYLLGGVISRVTTVITHIRGGELQPAYNYP